MRIKCAAVLAHPPHGGQQVRKGTHRRLRRFGDDRIEVGQQPGVVVERLLVDGKHAGGIADAEVPLAREPEGDPAGGGRDVGNLGRLVRLRADGPQPPRRRQPLGALHAEPFREFMPLALVAAVAPEPRGAQRAAELVGEHLTVHLAGDADPADIHLDAGRAEFLPQIGQRHAERLLPVAGVLLVTLGREARDHVVEPLARCENVQRLVGEDHRESLRAGIDAKIARSFHGIPFRGGSWVQGGSQAEAHPAQASQRSVGETPCPRVPQKCTSMPRARATAAFVSAALSAAAASCA